MENGQAWKNMSIWKLLHAHTNVWSITCTWTKAGISTLTVTRTRFLRSTKRKTRRDNKNEMTEREFKDKYPERNSIMNTIRWYRLTLRMNEDRILKKDFEHEIKRKMEDWHQDGNNMLRQVSQKKEEIMEEEEVGGWGESYGQAWLTDDPHIRETA